MKRSDETTTGAAGRRARPGHGDAAPQRAPEPAAPQAQAGALVPPPSVEGGRSPAAEGERFSDGPGGGPHRGERTGTGPGAALDRDRVRERLGTAVNGFVDDPGKAVGEADLLADEVARALIEGIEARRSELRASWEDGADTERLRLALRDYRVFVDGLLDGRLP